MLLFLTTTFSKWFHPLNIKPHKRCVFKSDVKTQCQPLKTNRVPKFVFSCWRLNLWWAHWPNSKTHTEPKAQQTSTPVDCYLETLWNVVLWSLEARINGLLWYVSRVRWIPSSNRKSTTNTQESFGGILNKVMKACKNRNMTEMETFSHDEWAEIHQEFCQKLVTGDASHLQEVMGASVSPPRTRDAFQ